MEEGERLKADRERLIASSEEEEYNSAGPEEVQEGEEDPRERGAAAARSYP